MIYKSVAVLALIVLSAMVYAGTSANYVAPSGSMGLGTDGKQSGDVISLQTDFDVANYCDFTKQIVATRTSILCVYKKMS